MKTMLKLFCVAMMAFSFSVAALDLHSAKGQGLVGETDSGYLGAVSASAETTALVSEVNAQRKAQYERIATKNGISLKDVEQLAAKKALEKTPAGQYIKIGGSWMKK